MVQLDGPFDNYSKNVNNQNQPQYQPQQYQQYQPIQQHNYFPLQHQNFIFCQQQQLQNSQLQNNSQPLIQQNQHIFNPQSQFQPAQGQQNQQFPQQFYQQNTCNNRNIQPLLINNQINNYQYKDQQVQSNQQQQLNFQQLNNNNRFFQKQEEENKNLQFSQQQTQQNQNTIIQQQQQNLKNLVEKTQGNSTNSACGSTADSTNQSQKSSEQQQKQEIVEQFNQKNQMAISNDVKFQENYHVQSGQLRFNQQNNSTESDSNNNYEFQQKPTASQIIQNIKNNLINDEVQKNKNITQNINNQINNNQLNNTNNNQENPNIQKQKQQSQQLQVKIKEITTNNYYIINHNIDLDQKNKNNDSNNFSKQQLNNNKLNSQQYTHNNINKDENIINVIVPDRNHEWLKIYQEKNILINDLLKNDENWTKYQNIFTLKDPNDQISIKYSFPTKEEFYIKADKLHQKNRSKFHNKNKVFFISVLKVFKKQYIRKVNMPQELFNNLIGLVLTCRMSGCKLQENKVQKTDLFNHSHYNLLFQTINSESIQILENNPLDVEIHIKTFGIDLKKREIVRFKKNISQRNNNNNDDLLQENNKTKDLKNLSLKSEIDYSEDILCLDEKYKYSKEIDFWLFVEKCNFIKICLYQIIFLYVKDQMLGTKEQQSEEREYDYRAFLGIYDMIKGFNKERF